MRAGEAQRSHRHAREFVQGVRGAGETAASGVNPIDANQCIRRAVPARYVPCLS